MDYFLNLPKKNNTKIIYDKINELINTYFVKLNMSHKKILIKYLYRVVLMAYFFFYNDKFIEQLYLNNYQDIFSFLVLLLPYYELNMSMNIISLDELFINLNSKAKSLSSSFYVDHLNLSSANSTDNDYIEKYFMNSAYLILKTLENVHCSLIPNWINVFPYTMDNYKSSNIYKNFKKIFNEKNFNLINDNYFYYENTDKEPAQLEIASNHFILGYHKLFGTIHNFLYMDIKPIKWMIYDLNLNNEIIIPNIIYLCEKLKINSILNNPWDKMTQFEKDKYKKLWNDFYNSSQTNKISIQSLILFYLKWIKDNDNLEEIELNKKCFEKIKIDFINIIDVDNDNDNQKTLNDLDDNDEKIIHKDSEELTKCLDQIYPLIKLENLYNYIWESMHRFKYTWYGYICMDSNNVVLSPDNFFSNYFQKFEGINKININENKPQYYYVTPKNIYNLNKSIIHHYSSNKLFVPICLTPSWDNIFDKVKFVYKLNHFVSDWFNINNNLSRTYQTKNKQFINSTMDNIKKYLYNSDMFVDVIFQTLIYNGMLSYFIYNPKLTDNKILPDKNKNHGKWKNYILSNIDIKSYSKSYHPFSNTMLESNANKKKINNTNIIDNIKNSLWYTNFGANWIAQIQLYHHYMNNRVLYITGATGAGKSTVAPFLLVYAIKMINFKNDAKVVCTQPRTQPVKDNSLRIAESIGYPITIKKDDKLDSIDESFKKTSIDEGVPQNINYIQYKHMKGTLTDDLYHPYLRMYTDGSLYNIIKQNYLFKKIIPQYSESTPKFSSTNLFDIILIDEAHEHNTNMDLILTLSKFATYVNNQVTLGIISATMDDDEIIYRKYFEPIDDNWKYPLNVNMFNFDKNLIDRRIHLSIPFGGTNFEVQEYPNEKVNYPQNINTFTDIKKINTKVKEILKHILSTTYKGDILIFQPGESDIKKLIVEINNETPSNVLAIPFYSKLDKDILEGIVKKIDKDDVRKKLRYPKNKYDITDIKNIPNNELLPEGTYNRFIILATNIAEASITIDTFEFVIDIGNQKINIYDYKTNQSKLEIIPIAVPNQKQRKGRVGRVKPGHVFYTYDRFSLDDKVRYKLNDENISSFIFDLVRTTNLKLIDSNSDPYKNNNYNLCPDFLLKQYCFYNDGVYLSQDIVKFKKRITGNIIYPYADGKYDLDTLKDENGIFYMIHPNEEYFIRDLLTLKIISKNKLPNYFNKIEHVFNYGKDTGIVGDNNLLTKYGILINNLNDFIEFVDNSLDFTKIILDIYSFNLIKDEKISPIVKNVILYFVFKNEKLNFKIENYLIGKSDFLIITKKITNNLFDLFKLTDIYDHLDSDLKNLNNVVKNYLNTILFNINFDQNKMGFFKNSDEIKKLLVSFYQIKIKFDIINFNNKFILKKSFGKIIDIIDIYKKSIRSKKLDSDIINEYLNILELFELYYKNCKKFMEKNILLNLLTKLKKKSVNSKLDKFTTKFDNELNKIIFKMAIFENENLMEINLKNNKKYSEEILYKFDKLTEYDKLCFLISKNSTQNVLIKIPQTQFYINYFDKDINILYTLEKNFDKYTLTKVSPDIRNFFIFAIDFNDRYELNNIMVINQNVIILLVDYLNENNIGLFKKNINFDKKKAEYIYGDKIIEIYKKIDKITKYITEN